MKLYTIKETAAMLSVHPNTIRNWIKTGKLKAMNVNGRTIRIFQAELERLGNEPTN